MSKLTHLPGWLLCILYGSIGIASVFVRSSPPSEAAVKEEVPEWAQSLRYTITDLGPLPSIPYYRRARSHWDQPRRLSAGQARSLLKIVSAPSSAPTGQADARTKTCQRISCNRRGQWVSAACSLHPGQGCFHTGKAHFALAALGGQRSVASDVNDVGEIVGYVTDRRAESRAVLWFQGGNPRDLGTLGGGYSYARAINNRGEIVGESELAAGESSRAFLYLNGEMIDLGALSGTESCANSLNDSGQVVGYADTKNGNSRAAFLWERGLMVDLNEVCGDPRWRLTNAWEITASGQILGEGVFGGKVHAFLLTPQ